MPNRWVKSLLLVLGTVLLTGAASNWVMSGRSGIATGFVAIDDTGLTSTSPVTVSSYTAPADGLYRVQSYIEVTTGAGVATIVPIVTYKDDTQSQSLNMTPSIALSTAGAFDQKVVFIRVLATQTIICTQTVTGVIGSAVYRQWCAIERVL